LPGNNLSIPVPSRESLVSDIPAGDGKTAASPLPPPPHPSGPYLYTDASCPMLYRLLSCAIPPHAVLFRAHAYHCLTGPPLKTAFGYVVDLPATSVVQSYCYHYYIKFSPIIYVAF
jgi:hypothetical protein